MESREGDNNDLSQLSDSSNLLINSQYLENNDNVCRFFDPISTISPNTPIFIQSEQIDNSNNDNFGRISCTNEHLMLLTATPVNSSPSNDGYKTRSNGTDTLINNGESPHFSIHDPPLIRLSPTSPNNLFRHERFNEEFGGLANSISNAPFSPTIIDWPGQELYVKTENNSSDLTHSSLKQHSFTNSLSDNDLPSMLRRGRTNFPRNEIRENENLQNSPPCFRTHRDLKRKRSSNSDIDFTHIVNSSGNNSNTLNGRSSNFNSDNFIDLTLPDQDSNINNVDEINERLTPELSNRHCHWWPFKKHCNNSNFNLQPESNHSIIEPVSSTTADMISTFPEDSSPTQEEIPALHHQFSVYGGSSLNSAWSSNSEPCGNVQNQQNSNEGLEGLPHPDIRQHGLRDSSSIPTSNYSTPSLDASFLDRRNLRSSYFRQILVPHLRHGRYLTPDVIASAREREEQFLTTHVSRSHNVSNHFGSTDSAFQLTSIRRMSSGSYVQSAIHETNRNMTESNLQQNYSNRPYSYFRQSDTSSISNDLVNNDSINRISPVGSALNNFLRVCGLEEVRQRRQAEDNVISTEQQELGSILNVNTQELHPLMRLSERNFLNVMLDHRSPSQFTHPFTMYESQGNMESVIQLALHLETSWRGINPSELAQLPCHYYKNNSALPGKDLERQDKCMVCLEEFVENDHLRTLSCSHQYHVMCVDKWLKMNRTCPMCRADATRGSSSYIFVN